MSDLRDMGESNALFDRKWYTHKDVFLAADAIYKSIYGNPDGTIPATVQVISIIGWKQTDVKPLKRGSATERLSNALK